MLSSLKTLAPLSLCLASWGVVAWYLVCLAPLLWGLVSLFLLMLPCAFFSELARLRMPLTVPFGFTFSITPSFSSLRVPVRVLV